MSTIISKLESSGNWLLERGWSMLDGLFPPERRAEWIARLKAFTIKHPKVMGFLLTNLALTGGPLAFFIIFGITVFVFSLIVALVVGLLVAVSFTLLCVGVALLILFPVIFFTTLTACFLFLTALGGYWAFKWMNSGNASLPTAKGNAIGDSLNQMTGGKLDWVMGQVREGKVEQALGPMQQAWREPSARNTPVSGSGNTPKKLNKKSSNTGPNTSNKSINNDNKQELPASPSDDKENEPSGISSGTDFAKQATNVKNNASTEGATKALGSGTGVGGAGDVSKKATGASGATSGMTGTVKGGLGGATAVT